MDNEMDNDYFDPAFTREDLDFALSLEDQFALEGDEKVPFIDPVSGEFMGEISGAEADALTWMNSDTLGFRAFGGAEDQDVAENRITMGQDDWMGAVKYDLRWRGFRNTTSDIIQHYGIGEIPALAMLNDIAGETTRTNESVRLGGTPGAILGEQNIPGLRSGPVGSEQTIFDMMADTGGNVMESLGFFDKSIMGIVASGAGLHSNLVDMSPDRLAPTTREKLLPMMVAAARVMNPGQNTDLLDAASNGDPEAFNGLYNMLKATRLTMGEADFGAATLISHLDEFTDFTQQAKEVGLIEDRNSAQLDLNDTITQVFLVRQTQDLGVNGAYAFINGKTPEERAAGLGAVASASTVFGPDFFQQSIAFVSEKDFKPNEGWAKLDDKRRGFLEANGITLDVLIEGGAQIRNQATLLFLADAEIMHIVGHKNRTRLFNKEYGEGSWWGATTRFGGDMYRGMADDPMAQFDMTVGLATGGAGAIRFSARKLAGATFWSNTGRFLVENAVAEGTLGVISGYAASADAQTRLFDRGSTSVQIDTSLQAEDAAFVGAMSAGFSVAIPVVLGGAVKGTAKAVGGTLRASERGGLLGSRAQEMREAYDLSRMLSSDDLHHALLYGQIPPEVAVRAIASDSAALDIVSTFIKRHVEKNGPSEGWDVHSIEAMLDAGELARHGMSRVEVVNFVMAIATDLGKDGKIGAAELDSLFKGYLIQRAEATRANVKVDPKKANTKLAESEAKAEESAAPKDTEVRARKAREDSIRRSSQAIESDDPSTMNQELWKIDRRTKEYGSHWSPEERAEMAAIRGNLATRVKASGFIPHEVPTAGAPYSRGSTYMEVATWETISIQEAVRRGLYPDEATARADIEMGDGTFVGEVIEVGGQSADKTKNSNTKIKGIEVDPEMKAEAAPKAEADKVLPIAEPTSTVTRAERLQIAMAQRDAEAAANFATSQRVTSDPSPKQRRKAENTMASLTRGEEVSRGDVKSLIETITAMRDGRAIDSAISFLLDTDMKAYLSDDQLGKIIQDLSEMKIAGRKAIDADPTLRRAIELRAVMTNVANDLTTRSASGLGMTTRQIAKFINAYIATAGNTVQRAKLLNDNKVGKSVIDKLYEDGGVKTLLVDEGRASYDFAAFRRSEEYANIRAVRASRTKLANDINSARAKFSRSSEDLAKALNDIRKNAEKNLREKYNKLGVDDYDAVTAIERMEADAKTFENLTAVERRLLMSNALTRLVDRVDPELVSPTGTNADRVSLTHMFENTPIADKLEALLARVALFPQSQARLFRSNMRLIRAGAQFIGNQHIGRRRYGSRADLSSIEGVANAAMMETIGVRRAARDMAIKLGSKAYNQFQSALQQLRIRGLLVDDTPAVRAALTKMIAEQMPELLRKYNGNATTMLDDMFNLNNKMTDYFQRVFENAKRNGSMQSSGVDPRKYVPHNLNSRLSATQRADFVKSMAALKQKQYEEDGSQLVLDALVELGWLRRETTKSEVVLEGPNVSVQQINYTVPEDSPFRGISGKTVADDAAYVIKNAERGRAFLTELQDKILTPEAPKPKNAKKRPKKSAVGDDTVTPGTKTEATEPLTPEGQPTPKPIASKPNASRRGNASAGDVMRPISRTAEEDGRANFISDLIHHSDPELQKLNKRLASMQAMDRENLTDAEIASLIIHYDSALKEVSVRVDQLMAEGDRLLDEAGEVPQGSLRSDMDANDISAAIMDKTLYDVISPSHKALRHNYDELVAQGVLTRESADMVLAAFADIPALKLIGITIRNNDSFLSRASTVFHYNRTLRHELYALAYEGNPDVKSVKGHRGSDTMRSLEQEMEDDITLGAMHPDAIGSGGNYPRQLALDGKTIKDTAERNTAGGVANRDTDFELEGDVHGDNHDFVSRVLLHEVGHMLFADAPRELKLAVQELYAREVQSSTNGEGRGPIAQLFENLGYSERRIEYGFSNVHEFMAVLAELSLFNNRTMRTTAVISAGSNSAILRVLAGVLGSLKKIIRKFVKDSDKLMVVARQTEGLDEVKMRALLDTVYAMAHGRKTQIRHAARLDEVFGLNYDRDQFAVNRYVDRTFWADTSDELGVDWRDVQSRIDVEAENTIEIPEFLIDSGRTSMSSFAMTSPRLFAEYAERLGVEPDVLLRRDRGDRLLQTIAETDEGNIRLSPGDFKLAEDMLLDQVAIVDEMLDTATGKNIYSKIVERFGNSGESIFDLMRDRAWIKSRTNTLDSDGTYLQEWEITEALNGLEKAMTIRDEADKSLAKLYNSEKKEPDTYSAIVDKFGAMFEEGFRTVDQLASDFPNEAMAYLQRVRELDLKNGGKGSLTQNQQDLMFAARDELDARKEANRLQREGRITRAEEQVTNANDGDTVRITDADLELLENRLHEDIGAAFDMRDAKSLPEMALAIAELEKVFGRTMNELVDIINNTDSLSFVTGEQKLIKLFEDSETQGYTPDDFERFRETIDEFIEVDARANQAKKVIEKIERITIDNTASSNVRPLRSQVTSGLSEDDRLMLEALQASMKQGDLTGPQEQLLRELGDKVMAAENPAVKPTKTKSKNDQWHLRLAEQDQAFQEDLMGAEGIYYGHLNGDIRDSTMAELVDNNGVHTLKSGGRAGESTDVLGLFRAMKDKSLSKEERQGKKRLFLAWVKNAKSSYVSQQLSVKKVSEESKTSVALQEQTRLANRESTERPTPGVWVGQIKEKDQDGDSVYGMWEGLRNAARQSSDEETALDIERGLAMIDLLGEFGDELYSAGLISSTPAKRLTDFVASSVDFTGKSNKQIADIRKVYSPTFWVGDKLTGKKSTPEGRELLERIRTAAVERGFGAGGNLGSFTVAVHVRQPATVLEKMYAASADMSKRGILPAAEEAAPVTKPVKAADTGITKASDDANSTGEVGKIAPGSNIDKEGLVKIAEAASDYNEFSRLVRAKYGDEAVDGEHFDIVDDYYDRLNPEVVAAKDTLVDGVDETKAKFTNAQPENDIINMDGEQAKRVAAEAEAKQAEAEQADVEAGDTLPPSKTKFDIEVDRWRNGTPALHGGSWDGITTMRDWTHFSVDRATAEDRINQKGIDGEYPEDAELQVVELFLKPKTRLLSVVDNGEPHDTPESLIDATRSVVYEFLYDSQMEENVALRATSPDTFSNETDKLYARAEKLREEVRDKTITSEQLYAAQKKIMAEYAAMMRRDDIHGFTYTNISEGDKGNTSFMLVDQSRLQPKRDAAAAAKEVEATQARANKLREEYAAMTDEQWKDGPGSRDPDADGVSEPERKAWFDKYFEINAREQELRYGSKEEGDMDYDDPDLTYKEIFHHAVDILFPGVADFLNRIHSGDITPQNVTLQEIQTLRHFMRLSDADIMYDVANDISQSDYGFFGDNKGLPGDVDFSSLLNKIGSYLQGFGNPGQLGPVTYRRYNGPRIQASEAEQAIINRLGLAETMAYSQVQITMYRGTGSRDASRWRPDVLYDEGFDGGRDNARDGNFFSPDPEVASWYGDNIMPVFLDIQKPFFAGGVHVSMMPTNAELRAHGYDAIILSNGIGNDLMARNGHMEINFIGNHDQVYSAISGQTYGESRRATPTTTTDAPEVRATTQIIEAEKAVKATAEEEAIIRELASTELPVEGSGAAVGKSIDLEGMSLKDLRAYVKDNDLNVSAKSAASLRNKIREAEKAEAITKARAGSGEGIPPKDPPKTARGADGEGEEPKPDKKPKKTKKGRSLRIKDDILDLILGRKASEKQVTPSHINPKYKGNLLEEYNAEIASGRAANARAEQYVQTQATNMSSSRINTTQGIDMDVAVKNSMNRLDNRMDREFSDADMEGPEGAELARLFGENSDIEELMVNYGRSVGTKVKLTDVMNELGGTRGYSMADFFAQMEEAGMAILETDAKTGKRNLRATEAEADAFKNYVGQLKHLYLQTLGYNVSKFDKNTALSRGLQVAQNMVYSRLGGTFSASVVLTEGPMNLLRTGGLGPAQLLKNGTTLITGIAQIIGGVTARNIPGMSKFMSALGLDVKRMRYIGEDIVMAMENNNSNALSKFGLAEDAEAGNAAIHSVKGRVAAHGRRIWAGGGDVTEDDRFLGGLTARVEATTAAAADLTGVASGMSQVISLVKSMAISIGQNVLVRHGDGLIRMGDAMAKIKDPLTRKQLIDLGRTHKVPKQAVILAAEAGLLSDGASTLKIMKHELGINYGRGGSRGRDLDLQELQDAINARRENRTYSEAGGMGLDELQARQAEIDDKAVGQVQNFLLLFAQQGSPELKGSMKFTAGDPLRSFLFAMTSYPMAAYQHLVANGVATKSGAAAYGTLSALVVLEYNNRLLQQMLYGKDEETKKKALDKLQRVYSGDIETEDIVEVLAMYGTMSPAFGAWGKYSKDLLGLPIATAAGVDTSGHFRANPFLGPVGGTISNMYGKAISPLTKMQSDSTAKRERSLSNFISTAIDAGTPLNNATFQAISSNLTGKRIGDLIGEIAVKGDMAGRAGSPGGSAPNFARGRGSRWYSQRRQPDSLSDTPNFNQVVDTFLPKIPPPVEPQQATQPPASPNPLTAEDLVRSGKGSASSSLADMLQQRKQ